MGGIEATLAEHAFEHLFIECLGWGRVRGAMRIVRRGVAFKLRAIAHKRGFTVLVCPVDRTLIADRRLLRELQKQIRKTHNEHILIFYSETPRKQAGLRVQSLLPPCRDQVGAESMLQKQHRPPGRSTR